MSRNEEPITCGLEQKQALEEPRNRLFTFPELRHFGDDTAGAIHTDDSNENIGAILEELQNGVEEVIANARPILSRAKVNYLRIKKKCLPVLRATTNGRRGRVKVPLKLCLIGSIGHVIGTGSSQECGVEVHGITNLATKLQLLRRTPWSHILRAAKETRVNSL